MYSRSSLSPSARASFQCMSMQKAQRLSCDARTLTSSRSGCSTSMLSSSRSIAAYGSAAACRFIRLGIALRSYSAHVIRVCVAGVTGWTGSAVAEAVEAADDLELVAGVSRSDPARFSSVAEALDAVAADVVVDYTHAEVVKANVLAALERGVGVVVGSSGLSAADYDEIDALAREKQVGV